MSLYPTSRLVIISLLACFGLMTTSLTDNLNPASNQGFALVELFTSQGCSSCPPADVVLNNLTTRAEARQQAVFTLSFHVDYWNHLGWKDPYSSKAFSDRQRRYAMAFHSESIYTPQMIVNGQTEFVGSSKDKADASVEQALQTAPIMRLQASAKALQNFVRVEYTSSELPENTVLNIALVRSVEPLSVNAGENSGRKLSHTHVVHAFETIPLSKVFGVQEIQSPRGFLDNRAKYRMIAYLQNSRTMRVLAATMITIE